MVADARSQPRDEALRHVYRVLTKYVQRYVRVNGSVMAITNLLNAQKYGIIWHFNDYDWGGDGSEVSKLTLPLTCKGSTPFRHTNSPVQPLTIQTW